MQMWELYNSWSGLNTRLLEILMERCVLSFFDDSYQRITYRVLRIFCEQLFSMLDKLILCALRGYCSTSPQTGSCSAKPELKMLK